jgi:threonine dehydrogenase-like Zn-dependent dehydrogenase
MVMEPRRLSFVEEAEPAVGPNEVKIRVRYSGLSARSEIERYVRNYAGKPEGIGYNLVGRVDEIGSEVTELQPGDRVFATVGHAEVVVVPAREAFKIPDGVDDEVACFAYLPTLGVHALRLANYRPGETVAIAGQGIIGQTAGLVARLYGARTIVLDVSAERLELARRAGAHLALDPSADGVRPRIAAFCGDAGLDVVVDTASTWRSLAQSLDLAGHRGRVVLLGIIRDAPTAEDAAAVFDAYRRNLHPKELAIIGASNDPDLADPPPSLRFTYRRNVEEVLQRAADGSLNLRQLITHRYPARRLEDVYRLLLNGGGSDHLGVVFEWLV